MGDELKIHVIGIGDDGIAGLTSRARELIEEAEVVYGAAATLGAIGDAASSVREIPADPEVMVEQLARHEQQRVVILAYGDPLFYGTARFLCDRLGKDRFEVVPHVSSMQLAFARVKESWDEAYLANLANQSLERVVDRARTASKVGLFTTEEHTPGDVARALLDRQVDYFSAYVCENLGSPDERVTHGSLDELADQPFSPLNVMILVRRADAPDRPREMAGRRLFGNPDDAFLQSLPKRGLVTPAEVRCLALAEMDLGASSIVWDVGAGSGSVAIEAAQLAAAGHAYAIEMDPEDHALILRNAERFAVGNLTAVLGRAPEAWERLPDPDAVFVGGAGRQVCQIVEQALPRLRPGGRIVANVTGVENLAAVHAVLTRHLGEAQLWMINVARGNDQLESIRFDPHPPTFLVGGVRPVQ